MGRFCLSAGSLPQSVLVLARDDIMIDIKPDMRREEKPTRCH